MKLSIITATYNAASELPGLIDSLRHQTDPDFEWVVMDGASTDGTRELIRCVSDLPVVWHSEADFGIYDALNKAIRVARGEHYVVVGADDRLDPGAVEGFKRLIADTGADIATTPVRVGSHTLVERPLGPAWLHGARAHVTCHAVGTAFRRSLHERFGMYSRRFPITADLLFISQAVRGGARVVQGRFIAGTYSDGGVSATDVAGVMSEFFRVQLEVEPNRPLQLLIHLLRLLKNAPKLVRGQR